MGDSNFTQWCGKFREEGMDLARRLAAEDILIISREGEKFERIRAMTLAYPSGKGPTLAELASIL